MVKFESRCSEGVMEVSRKTVRLDEPMLEELQSRIQEDVSSFFGMMAGESDKLPDTSGYTVVLDGGYPGAIFVPDDREVRIPLLAYAEDAVVPSPFSLYQTASIGEELGHAVFDSLFGSPPVERTREGEIKLREFYSATELYGRSCFVKFLSMKTEERWGRQVTPEMLPKPRGSYSSLLRVVEEGEPSPKDYGYSVGHLLGDNFVSGGGKMGELTSATGREGFRGVLEWVSSNYAHKTEESWEIGRERFLTPQRICWLLDRPTRFDASEG